jgi:hypothetical protein
MLMVRETLPPNAEKGILFIAGRTVAPFLMEDNTQSIVNRRGDRRHSLNQVPKSDIHA